MKKIMLLFSLAILLVACGKDKEPAKPIDKFVGKFDGKLREYKCSDTLVILNTFENYSVTTTEKSESSISGKLSDEKGETVFNFVANLDTDNDSKIRITSFTYGSETLFGGGEVSNGKLKLQFASNQCPIEGNTYRVTREFSAE